MTSAESPPWGTSRLLAFRLGFCFWLLTCLPVPEGMVGLPGGIEEPFYAPWHRLVPWVGAHVLHLSAPIQIVPTGSSDTTYAYVKLLTIAVLSVLAAALWSVVDRRAKAYPRLEAGLRVYLRYVLALVMLSYGFAKVFPGQFVPPPTYVLMEPYSDSSPMGLLWRFMGSSQAYVAFAGGAELLGALLLMWRRTTTLGVLVTAGVMTNVVMLNFCYDVPVKLGSSLLLALAIFLVAPDVGRLTDLLIFQRPTQPRPLGPELPQPWMRWAYVAGKVLLIAFLLIPRAQAGWQAQKRFDAPKDPLDGSYEVERMVRKGAEVPPLLTDKSRWRRVFIFDARFMQVRLMDETRTYFTLKNDSPKHTLILLAAAEGGAEAPAGSLEYSWSDPQQLVLHGTVQGDALELHLRKVDRRQFLLVKRGFHWMQEFSFNR